MGQAIPTRPDPGRPEPGLSVWWLILSEAVLFVGGAAAIGHLARWW